MSETNKAVCAYKKTSLLFNPASEEDRTVWGGEKNGHHPKNMKEDKIVVFWPSTRPKMPFQGDALEGSDTF